MCNMNKTKLFLFGHIPLVWGYFLTFEGLGSWYVSKNQYFMPVSDPCPAKKMQPVLTTSYDFLCLLLVYAHCRLLQAGWQALLHFKWGMRLNLFRIGRHQWFEKQYLLVAFFISTASSFNSGLFSMTKSKLHINNQQGAWSLVGCEAWFPRATLCLGSGCSFSFSHSPFTDFLNDKAWKEDGEISPAISFRSQFNGSAIYFSLDSRVFRAHCLLLQFYSDSATDIMSSHDLKLSFLKVMWLLSAVFLQKLYLYNLLMSLLCQANKWLKLHLCAWVTVVFPPLNLHSGDLWYLVLFSFVVVVSYDFVFICLTDWFLIVLGCHFS